MWEAGGGLTDANQKKVEQILGPLSAKTQANTGAIPGPEISSFGLWLREQRSKAPMSVPELATQSGVSTAAIYRIEGGIIQNPQSSTLDKLSKALKLSVPIQVVKETEQSQEIAGLGTLTDFLPHSKNTWPKCAGVYALYDVSQRPIYIGKADKISARLSQNYDRFWCKSHIVEFGSYFEVKDKQLRHQLEQVMIKFLKSSAVINKQSTEGFDEE